MNIRNWRFLECHMNSKAFLALFHAQEGKNGCYSTLHTTINQLLIAAIQEIKVRMKHNYCDISQVQVIK